MNDFSTSTFPTSNEEITLLLEHGLIEDTKIKNPCMLEIYRIIDSFPFISPGFKEYVHDLNLWNDDVIYHRYASTELIVNENKAREHVGKHSFQLRLVQMLRILYNNLTLEERREFEDRGTARIMQKIESFPAQKDEILRTIIPEVELTSQQEIEWIRWKQEKRKETVSCPIENCRNGGKMRTSFYDFATFHAHFVQHGVINIFGCHRCFRLFHCKTEWFQHQRIQCTKKEQDTKLFSSLYALVCVECGYSYAYNPSGPEEDQKKMFDDLKKLTANHGLEQIKIVFLTTAEDYTKPFDGLEKSPCWLGTTYVPTIDGYKSCSHMDCRKSKTVFHDFDYIEHIGNHLEQYGIHVWFVQFLKEKVLVEVGETISLNNDECISPQRSEIEEQLDPNIKDYTYKKRVSTNEKTNLADLFSSVLFPSNQKNRLMKQLAVSERKPQVFFGYRFQLSSAPPGVLQNSARILQCCRCGTICIGLDIALRHVRECVCSTIGPIDLLRINNDYVVELASYNHSPNHRFNCVEHGCGKMCCSVQGYIVHMGLIHGKLYCPDNRNLEQFHSNYRQSSVNRFSFVAASINQFCQLTKDCHLQVICAHPDDVYQMLSEEELAHYENGDEVPEGSKMVLHEDLAIQNVQDEDLPSPSDNYNHILDEAYQTEQENSQKISNKNLIEESFGPEDPQFEHPRIPILKIRRVIASSASSSPQLEHSFITANELLDGLQSEATTKQRSKESFVCRMEKKRERREKREEIEEQSGQQQTTKIQRQMQTITVSYRNACFECGLEMISKENLVQHLKHHELLWNKYTNMPDLKCYFCDDYNESITSFEEYLSHIITQHYREPEGKSLSPRLCQFCSRTFKSNELFVAHFRHDCYYRKKCTLCGIDQSSWKYSKKQLHINQEHKETKRFECSCKLSFANLILWEEHVCDINKRIVAVRISAELLHGVKVDQMLSEVLMKQALADENRSDEPTALIDNCFGGNVSDKDPLTPSTSKSKKSPNATTDDDPIENTLNSTSVNTFAEQENVHTSIVDEIAANVRQEQTRKRKLISNSDFNSPLSKKLNGSSSMFSTPNPDILPSSATSFDRGDLSFNPDNIVTLDVDDCRIDEVSSAVTICPSKPIASIDDDDIVELPGPSSSNATTYITDEGIEMVDVHKSGTGKIEMREAQFKCSSCSEAFITKRGLYEHMNYLHAKDISTLDPTCSNVYGIPRKGLGYLCPICVAVFEDENRHKHHMDLHVKLNREHHTICEYCSAVAVTPDMRDKHMGVNGHGFLSDGSSQTNIITEMWCTLCKPCKVFQSDAGYYLHIKEAHDTPIFFFCKNCLLGSCDITLTWNHIYGTDSCFHEEEHLQRRIGFAVATELHYQPVDEEKHQKKDKTDYVRATSCSTRSMIRFPSKYATCAEKDDHGQHCHALTGFTRFENYLCRKNNYFEVEHNSLPQKYYPQHVFVEYNYNMYQWLLWKFQAGVPPRLIGNNTVYILEHIIFACSNKPLNKEKVLPPAFTLRRPTLGKEYSLTPQPSQRDQLNSKPAQPHNTLVDQTQQTSQQIDCPHSQDITSQTLPRILPPSFTRDLRARPHLGHVQTFPTRQLTDHHTISQQIRRLPCPSEEASLAQQDHVVYSPNINGPQMLMIPSQHMIERQGHSSQRQQAERVQVQPVVSDYARLQRILLSNQPSSFNYFPQHQASQSAHVTPQIQLQISAPQIQTLPQQQYSPQSSVMRRIAQTQQKTLPQPVQKQQRQPVPPIIQQVTQKGAPTINLDFYQDGKERQYCCICQKGRPKKLMVSLLKDGSRTTNHTKELYKEAVRKTAENVPIEQLRGIFAAINTYGMICFEHVNPHGVKIFPTTASKGKHKQEQFVLQEPEYLCFNYPDWAYPALDKHEYLTTLSNCMHKCDRGEITQTMLLNEMKNMNKCKNESCNHAILSNMASARLHGHHCEEVDSQIEGVAMLCTICWQYFANEEDMIIHFLSHAKINSSSQVYMDLRCPVPGCGVRYDQTQSLHKHFIEQHNYQIKSSQCKTVFATPEARDKHVRMHEVRNSNLDCCFLCGSCELFSVTDFIVRNRSQIKNVSHIFRHALRITYACKICMEGFETHSKLVRHCQTVHSIRKQHILHCGFCKCDLQESDVAQHISQRHELQLFGLFDEDPGLTIRVPPEMIELLGLSASVGE